MQTRRGATRLFRSKATASAPKPKAKTKAKRYRFNGWGRWHPQGELTLVIPVVGAPGTIAIVFDNESDRDQFVAELADFARSCDWQSDEEPEAADATDD
jgi:hypothetical protein